MRFALAWLCVVTPLMSSLYAQVDDDHGNDCSSATQVSLFSTPTGNIERPGDADYFQIQVSSSGTLNAFTTGSTDTAGGLRDGNCSAIAGNEDGGSDRNFRISIGLSEGTYYVTVEHGTSSGTGSYTLNLEFLGDSVDLRVTSLSVSASSAQVGQSVTVTWSIERGESDAAAVDFQHGIYLSNNTAISASDTLLKENGPTTLERSATTVSGSDTVKIPDVSEGTYYIGYLVDSTGVVDETEENAEDNNSDRRSIEINPDGCRDAISVAINSTRVGNIGSDGETDYFQIELPSSGTLTAFTTLSTDTVGNLRDSDCSTITSNDDGGLDTNFRISRLLTGGTYFVSVRHSDPEGSGTYTLNVEFQESSIVLVANFVNGNDAALNSRVYLWNPVTDPGDVTVRVFTLPVTGGVARELTEAPLSLGTLGARSALNIKVAEDILAPLGRRPYTEDDGDLTLEFTIKGADARGAAQVFSSSFASGTYPLQGIPSTSSGSPTVLVANFVNGDDAALNSRVYLFNPSASAGEVTVRVFTLPLAGGVAQELTEAPLSLGTLGADSALNIKVAEDILAPLGRRPYTEDDGDLTLEFTVGAADVRGAAQVSSSSFSFGVYALQGIPSTSSIGPTVLVANFMNGNSDFFKSRVSLFNPSASAGNVTVRVFTLPLSGGTARELTTTPLFLGTLGAKSALNVRLAEDILDLLGTTLPYIEDGGNLTLEFTVQAADVRGAAQVFSDSFAFGVHPLQEIPSISGASPRVLVANFMNGNSDFFNSRVYLWNSSISAGDVTVRVFTLPLTGGVARELTEAPLNLGTLGANSALNIKLAEDILTPLEITLPYTTDGGNLTLEFTIEAPDVRGSSQVFSGSFGFGTNPLQVIQ